MNVYRCIRYVTSGILTAFWVMSVILVGFFPQFYAKETTFWDPAYFPADVDYSLHMYGGSSAAESFYLQFPIGSGVQRAALEPILQDERIVMTHASVTHLSVPFFLVEKASPQPLAQAYLSASSGDVWFEHTATEEMIRIAGGDANTHGMVDLPSQWMTYDTVIYEAIADPVALDRDAFCRGTEIVAPADYCSVGDAFTFVIPVPQAEATEENIQSNVHFEVLHATVAAVYDGDRLILPLEYLFSVFPEMNYEEIYLRNLTPQDEQWTKELEQNLQSVAVQSGGVAFDDYAQLAEDFYRPIVRQLGVGLLGAVLLGGGVLFVSARMAGRKLLPVLGAGVLFGMLCGAGVLALLAYASGSASVGIIVVTNVLPMYAVALVFLWIGGWLLYRRGRA